MDQSDSINNNMKVESSSLVSNGCFDYKGRIADKRKTGGWKAAPFIIVNEVAERFAFFSIAVNMVAYLVGEMHQPLPEAAAHVGNWVGAAYILTLFGAFMADAYLGRFQTIITFSCIYAAGMVLLTLSGSIPSLRPPQCTLRPCPPATSGQTAFLYLSLALIAVGTGGIKPCVSSFGADQFDEADQTEASHKYSFFNWFFFAINTGALLGITLLVYAQVRLGWAWGLGIPAAATVASILVLAAGWRRYRYQRPAGSAFTRFAQVIVAAVRNRGKEVGGGLYEVEESKECEIHGATKLAHTHQYRFLDKAAVVTDPALAAAGTRNRWRLCTVTQVEELKCIVRIIPVWASTIALAISYSQISTFFVAQAATMDRSLSPAFSIPAGSTPVFSAVNALLVVPLYERLAVPFLRSRTGHPRGITSLQRIGAGVLVSVPAMVSAAVVERNRRSAAGGPRPSVFWLFPQCFLMGMAEVLAYVGQLEFFYDEATDGTRSISSALFLSEFGIGSWLSSALVEIVGRATGGAAEGWLRDDLNQSRLDYFYWLLAGINVVNFAVYLWVARRYKGRRVAEPAVAVEATEELGGGIGLQNGKGEESI
ncbi:major facilitator superfamily protein [Striga asiatica]|uniref:Major facilitator superfamily protein n=1 Tax=Striga asiatica TaxID=4170 RepID=A0A5A7PRY6_STRAF|nr:major facilitator superfamily protein [Striga asiatica]